MTDRRRTRNVSASLLLFLAVAVGAFAASGCARGRDGYGGTAVLSLLASPTGLNPIADRDIAGNVLPLLFNGLTRVDEQLAPVPDLAHSWEVSDDGLAWTFHLRRGVKFHDGEELTARDVIYTLRQVTDSATSPQLSKLFETVAGVEALSSYDLRVTLKSPYAPILYLLTVEVLPAHLLESGQGAMEAFGRSPVGTGPFRLDAWKNGEIVLAAFEEHFAGRPYLDSVVFRSFADRGKAWAALMQGSVDMVPDLEAADYAVIQGDNRFQVASYLDAFYHTVLFNLQDPLLRDPLVREALDLAIDRQDIIADTLRGLAVETTGPFIPGTWTYDPSLAKSVYDPKRSQELLASLGWKDTDGDSVLDREGKPLELGLLVDRGDTLKVAVAQRIKWQLFGLGVKVNVEFLAPQDLFQQRLLPGRYQTALLQFNALGDPDLFANLFWHSGQIGGYNLARYVSPEVDRLLEQGRLEAGQQKRAEIYRSIHRAMARDRPAAFLFVPRKLVGMSSRLVGVQAGAVFLYGSAKTWKIAAKPLGRR